MARGLRIERKLTQVGQDVFSTAEWETCTVATGSGKLIPNVEFPKFWSPNARQQVAEKYFRKADVPQYPNGILDNRQAEAQGINVAELPTGRENTLKQLVNRLAGALQHWGKEFGYFATEEDAQAFYDEIGYAMIHQYGALNSPQWFNTGLHWAYGLTSDAKGQFYYDFDKNEAVSSTSAYERPQAHACFILGVKDSLFDERGIYDTATLEARIFYFGSGAGSDYSTLRGKGEPVSGGGYSSGMMSYLKLFDVGGGVIKSGGKNRRSAKMDICHDTHPELMDFIRWKTIEEKKVRLLVRAGLDNHFEGEAYTTVSGMNSNNTVSLSHEFFKALDEKKDWHLRWVTDPSHICETLPAQTIWDEIVYCTWFSADPGIHAKGTINEWNTCLNDELITASNPCSEYLWFNETACNLASLNLVRYFDVETGIFDTELYRYHIRLWQLALDITVSMAQYPSKLFAEKSIMYRTTGLGYSNLGGLLMLMGLGYGTSAGQQVAGAITAILGGEAYVQSAISARDIGQYPRYKANEEHHLRVIRNHRRASYNAPHDHYEGLTIKPLGLDVLKFPQGYMYLLDDARTAWDNALELGNEYGYRNAQVTVLAPTGTISFAMDCDTFGGEPDYALKKYKLLAGGGWLESINRLVPLALKRLGYSEKEIGVYEEREVEQVADDGHTYTTRQVVTTPGSIIDYVFTHGTIEGAPFVRAEHYEIFDTAVKPAKGTRYLKPEAHIDMMAYQQPFLSGAISKTINLPKEATQEDISNAYLRGYYQGLKAIAVYRDSSKASAVMYTDKADLTAGLLNREPISLLDHEFDLEKNFSGQFPQESLPVVEEPVQLEAPEDVAEAVEMPTYGCKDGSCSI